MLESFNLSSEGVKMDKLLGALRSKTMWFSLVLAILSVVQIHIGLFTQLFKEPTHFGYFTAAIALAVAVLRWITNLPLSAK